MRALYSLERITYQLECIICSFVSHVLIGTHHMIICIMCTDWNASYVHMSHMYNCVRACAGAQLPPPPKQAPRPVVPPDQIPRLQVIMTGTSSQSQHLLSL
jgi:hypothetical protein